MLDKKTIEESGALCALSELNTIGLRFGELDIGFNLDTFFVSLRETLVVGEVEVVKLGSNRG
jgi:hypothetical protein